MSLLEVRDLVVSFGKAFRVGPANFAMDRGVLHIRGPNGRGKTTLMRAMSGGLIPQQGKVLVAGKDVHRSTEARRRIALVSAISEVPDCLSVAEAYQFTASIRGAPSWDGSAFCSKLNLDPRLPIAIASAGQRQKAELICGLAGDPDVLLLDETFAHLDKESMKQLTKWIAEWSSTRVVVFIHHGDVGIVPDAILHVDGERVSLENQGMGQ